MKVAILSFHSGAINRGAETWAHNLKIHLSPEIDVEIVVGWFTYNFLHWFNFDIIIPTNGRLQVLLARLVTWGIQKPLVVFGHSGPGADDKWNLWCSPDVFVAFSNYQAEWAKKFKLPRTKIIVIPHAVDTKLFKPVDKRFKNNVVLCVAANHPNKRVDLVRNAVKLLPQAELVVVGSGQEVQVSFEKMPEVYQQAKVFCFVPWKREAFGLVFLEAMACNLPIITIDDPVRREIVGDAGIFVDHPEDPAELASAIKKALNRDGGDLPWKQAEKFSWSTITSSYISLFKSLI